MKLCAQPKKLAILGGLLLVAGVTFCVDYLSGSLDSIPPPKPAFEPYQVAPAKSAAVHSPAHRRDSRSAAEFSIRQGTEPGAEKADPATIDPVLRVDLLAKLHQVDASGATRNIFQYVAAPPLATAPDRAAGGLIGNSGHHNPSSPPNSLADQIKREPQMAFKYYGYKISVSDGHKQAFLLDGEDIIIAGENDAVKAGRYRVVRIGVNSITIEDSRLSNEETLPIEPAAIV
jgi:hypothetical protein